PGHRFGSELGPQCLVGTFEDIRHTHRTTSPYLEFYWLKFIDSPSWGQGCCGQPLMPGMAQNQPQERNANSSSAVNAMDTSSDVPQPQRLLEKKNTGTPHQTERKDKTQGSTGLPVPVATENTEHLQARGRAEADRVDLDKDAPRTEISLHS